MTPFIELLKIIIPAGAVFAAAYFLVKRFLDNDQKRREHELRKSSLSAITPLKITAYERIVIFLERINPNNLVVRVNKNGMNARQLHHDLVATIKAEYEHNLSQQIYISEGAWELVKTAKEEIIRTINISSSKVPSDASSNDLAMVILNVASNSILPNDIAIKNIKREISQNF
ncbi:MAG: hypothetical protein ACK504_00940 [Bacteroidota bacterium]|jgi:hypothetical protein